MNLEFDPEASGRYPLGYWIATACDGDYDADGATPLDAVTTLVLALEIAMKGKV